MSPHYKDPIVVFGLVLPLVLVLVTLGLGFHFKSKFESTYKERLAKHEDYKRGEVERQALDAKVRSQEPHMNRWMALFDRPADSKVNDFVGEFQKQFDSTQFQHTGFTRSNTATGGIGGASAQSSVQLQLGFRGTYRALQNAFLELETRMPHLQLDSIKLSVSNPDRRLLTAKVTYTAWQK